MQVVNANRVSQIAAAQGKPLNFDSQDVMLDDFLFHLLNGTPQDTYVPSTPSNKAANKPAAVKPVETIHKVFNPATESTHKAKLPSIGGAVKIGLGALIKAALVTPFYAICRFLGMPNLSFMERAAIIGGNSVYQGYVKPAFNANA